MTIIRTEDRHLHRQETGCVHRWSNLRDKGFKLMASPNCVKFVVVALISICESSLPDDRHTQTNVVANEAFKLRCCIFLFQIICILFCCACGALTLHAQAASFLQQSLPAPVLLGKQRLTSCNGLCRSTHRTTRVSARGFVVASSSH